MKIKNILLLVSVAFLTSGCGLIRGVSSSVNSSSKMDTSSETSSSQSNSSSNPSSDSSSSSSSSEEESNSVPVAPHTLSDSNPPVVAGPGQEISSSKWESFMNASQSAFASHYNYTYTYRYSNAPTSIYVQKFTQNGYMIQNPNQNPIYYENAKGFCYSYINLGSGYVRSQSSEDIQSRRTYALHHEVQIHMKDMSNYDFIEDDDPNDEFHYGYYNYVGVGFGYQIKFQGNYITWMHAYIDGNDFEISAVFETIINIPASHFDL